MNESAPDDEAKRKSLKLGRALLSWRLLRSIGNSRAAKLTMLIPLVGYLVIFNHEIIDHLELTATIFGASANATLNKLVLIYFGLVCVAIASVIFAIWCPLEIKRYASPEEYVAGEEPFLSEKAIGFIQVRLKTGDEIARAEADGYGRFYRQFEPGNEHPALNVLRQ